MPADRAFLGGRETGSGLAAVRGRTQNHQHPQMQAAEGVCSASHFYDDRRQPPPRNVCRARRPVNRSVRLLGLVAALAVAGAAGAPASPSAAPSFVGGGTLSVCLDPSFPPMEFYEHAGDAEPVGVDIDLARALGREWHVQPRLIPVEFTGMLPALQARRCDVVISGVLLRPERVRVLHAIPYLDTNVVVVGRADSQLHIESELDLAGTTIAVESGTDYAKLLEDVNARLKVAGRPLITIQLYPKDADAIQQLLVGRAAGAVSQDVEVVYRNLQNRTQFKVLYRFPVVDRFAIYLRADETDEARVTSAIARLRASGELLKIFEHWKLGRSQDGTVVGR